jgi:hypothetical protein
VAALFCASALVCYEKFERIETSQFHFALNKCVFNKQDYNYLEKA